MGSSTLINGTEFKGIKEWCSFYRSYDEIYDMLNDGDTFVEIGCLYGESTIYFAKKIKSGNKRITFYAIDMWGKDETTDTYLLDLFKDGNTVYQDFLYNLNQAGVYDCVIAIQSDSSKAAKLFDDGIVNAIFFDGNHSFEGLSKDIEAWYSKVKDGGYIGGDDYLHCDSPGVKQAVDSHFDNIKLTDTTVEHKAWSVIKDRWGDIQHE